MKSFFINNYRVDMLRSQIIDQDDVKAMEPRVLKVLLLLAEKQDQVVTHQEILDKVWPDVIVAPNAIQRCIVQLRKALNDDAKNQRVIVTHPKIGYRLIAQVNIDIDQESVNLESSNNRLTWPAVTLFLLGMAAFFVFNQDNTPSRTFTKLTPLTATDQKEFYPSFSPNGQFVAFNRFHQGCASQLWLKDLNANREYLLTKDVGNYGQMAWSPDGSQIAFSQSSSCASQTQVPFCRDIRLMRVDLALTAPQETQLVLKCGETSYSAINWLNRDELVFIARDKTSEMVKSYSISSGKQKSLYRDNEAQLSALSYSDKSQKLAITVTDVDKLHHLVFYDMTNGNTRMVPFAVPETFVNHPWWDPIWHPDGQSLLVSARSSLFEVSTTGQFRQYQLPTALDIYNPSFHPTQNTIVASMGVVDLDLAEISLSNGKTNTVNEVTRTKVFRSTLEDYMGKYQPGGENVAFISHRSDLPQVWIEQGGEIKQLSQFEKYTHLTSLYWSPEGSALITVGDGKLFLVTLEGTHNRIQTNFNVNHIYQWQRDSELLLNITEGDNQKLIWFDLTTEKSKRLYTGNLKWAQVSEKHGAFFIDELNLLNKMEAGIKIPVTAFKNARLNPQFIIKNNQLLTFTEQNQLVSFDLNTELVSELPGPDVNQDYLVVEDVLPEQQKLLLSFIKASRKELVLFE